MCERKFVVVTAYEFGNPSATILHNGWTAWETACSNAANRWRVSVRMTDDPESWDWPKHQPITKP